MNSIKHSAPWGRRAFSLIELLVVIAIIAVLVALALPSFNALSLRGESTRSLAALRSIGTAWAGYAAENNGNYPPYPPTGTARTSLGWRAVSAMRSIVTPDVQVSATDFGNNPNGLSSAELFYTPLQQSIPLPPKNQFYVSGPYANEIGYNVIWLRPEGMGNRAGFSDFWNHHVTCPPSNPIFVDRCLSLWNQPLTKDAQCRILHLDGHVTLLPADKLNDGITAANDPNWIKLLGRMKTGQMTP